MKIKLTTEKAYLKITRFCTYQERTQQEVRHRLYMWEVNADEVEELIARLIEDNFLNEERFAKAYAGGKFRMREWGKVKIENRLKSKGLSSYCIKKGLQEINEEDYIQTLKRLIIKRKEKEKQKGSNPSYIRQFIYSYLITKGYESDLILKTLKEDN
jgi:regulatory protein